MQGTSVRNKWIWANSDLLSVTVSRGEAMIQFCPAAPVNTQSLARTTGGLWDVFGPAGFMLGSGSAALRDGKDLA